MCLCVGNLVNEDLDHAMVTIIKLALTFYTALHGP